MKRKTRIYIGTALTKAPKRHTALVQRVKRELVTRHAGQLIVLEFLGLDKGTETDVYDVDIGHTKRCDLFVGFVDHPAIGLGYEFATVVEARGIPFLILHRRGARPSRLVKGVVKRYAHRGARKRYDSVSEAVSAIEAFLKLKKLI